MQIAIALNFHRYIPIFISVAFYISDLQSFLKFGLNFDKSYISFPVVINMGSSQNSLHFKQDKHLPIFDTLIGCNFYRLALHYGTYILFTHQQLHFLLNLEKFNFTLEYT